MGWPSGDEQGASGENKQKAVSRPCNPEAVCLYTSRPMHCHAPHFGMIACVELLTTSYPKNPVVQLMKSICCANPTSCGDTKRQAIALHGHSLSLRAMLKMIGFNRFGSFPNQPKAQPKATRCQSRLSARWAILQYAKQKDQSEMEKNNGVWVF